jgi:hypothetical protein
LLDFRRPIFHSLISGGSISALLENLHPWFFGQYVSFNTTDAEQQKTRRRNTDAEKRERDTNLRNS